MKKIFPSIVFILICFIAKAQNNYTEKMNENIAQLNKANSITDYEVLFTNFSQIKHEGGKNSFQPYYYAALAKYKIGNLVLSSDANADINETNAIARKYILGGLSADPNQVEMNILLGFIELQKLRMNGGKENENEKNNINKVISIAEKTDKNNPRLGLLKADLVFYSSDISDGSNPEIKPLYENALRSFKTYQKNSSFAPNWGLEEVLSHLKK